MKKKFMLRETGRSTRYFETLEAANKAMEERIEYYIGRQILPTKFSEYYFKGYLDGRDIVISIKEYEVEG